MMFDPCGRPLGPGGFPLCDQSYSQSGPPLPVLKVVTVASQLNTVQPETGLYEKAKSIIRSWIHGRELDISGLGLKYIPGDLHPNMKHLNCSKNQLTNLHVLPPKLEHLNCSGNNLTRLPKLPDTLSFLDCRNNPNLIISSVPSSVKAFYYDPPEDDIEEACDVLGKRDEDKSYDDWVTRAVAAAALRRAGRDSSKASIAQKSMPQPDLPPSHPINNDETVDYILSLWK